MKEEVKEIEFEKLRYAYILIKDFLENESREKVESLNTKIVEDLSMHGDDNWDLLEKFVTKFEVDYNEFDYSKHFRSEGELINPATVFVNLLNLSIWLPIRTIEFLSLNKIDMKKPTLYIPKEHEDMTFRELLIWYIEGKYKVNKKIKYKIKFSNNSN